MTRRPPFLQANPAAARRWRALTGALLAALLSAPVAFSAPPAKPLQARTAQSKPAAGAEDPLARERETIDEVIAAALVGALSDELGGRPVKVKLDQVDVQVTSLRDRSVRGRGQLQIGNDPEWVGFRFETLYDAVQRSAGYPELSIGDVGDQSRLVPNDARLVGHLDSRVSEMLSREFGYQQVRLQLDSITTLETGSRYLRIDAEGIADFGRDGSAPAHVEALYDRIDGVWLRVSYALEPMPLAPLPVPAVQAQGAAGVPAIGRTKPHTSER